MMLHSTQELEPTANPARFSTSFRALFSFQKISRNYSHAPPWRVWMERYRLKADVNIEGGTSMLEQRYDKASCGR
jgi:hypothetical protein